MLSIKVLGFIIGAGSTSGILKALEMAYIWGADIVSMSLGSEPMKQEDSPIAQVINAASQNVIHFVAAGNDGKGQSINAPGCAQNAITVGSMSFVDREFSYYSSRGPSHDGLIKPDIVSFGGGRNDQNAQPKEFAYDIVASGALLDGIGDGIKNGFETMNGTSMATPRAAGICALWKEAYPDLNTGHIQWIMRERGLVKNNDIGHGLMIWDWIGAMKQ